MPQPAIIENGSEVPTTSTVDGYSHSMLSEWFFRKMLCLERKRAERSGRRLVLMLLESPSSPNSTLADNIVASLSRCIRDTDLTGWYIQSEVIGVLFTEIGAAESSVIEILSGKVRPALADCIGHGHAADIKLSFHVFPDDYRGQDPGPRGLSIMYPDLVREIDSRRPSLIVKRYIDIVGSLTLLLLLAPLLFFIALTVKATSKGPVLFRQKRLGQFGKTFTFLKFRSMYAETDHLIHEEYIKRFIGKERDARESSEPKVFKIKNDPRITKFGAVLRRTSLDELPQLFNVLTGAMSLVGPRPPLPYEFSSYEDWHRRRLFVKPGITGYWQVAGRSRVKFDDMVRMDLQYASSWSVWLDIQLLLRTPRAVVSGDGAY